ncbi:hypothetical protein [Streptomyces sp. H27-H5]|uniref:hypothetical protein n=1 Tax=Streptomyces sp. H27-H5 TaxID=2996460 RepID=UPI00226F1AD3|nr:hypothetical protein [Streptomyces sp. H27-H5]MCY0962192.1 hypothetical protein [Streptomyces sp. H27-H5]
MSSTSATSAADQQLLDHAHRHGLTVTQKNLDVWRHARLLPGNIPGGGLGRGKGSTSSPAPESFDLVLGLARHAGRGKRPKDLALLLFAEGLPVPETTVRAAFSAAVETLFIHGDDDEQPADPEERLDDLADHIDEEDLTVTLVPARARRIDERIDRLARAGAAAWPPAELLAMDENPGPSSSTPKDAALAAATAVISGSMSMDDVGDMLRAMNPKAAANPVASLVETTQRDAPDVAGKVLTEDGTLTLGPAGDARDHLRDLAGRAPLEDLATAWVTVGRVREWALGLCSRVEGELDAGHLGEAAGEWQNCRFLAARLVILSTLKDRLWPPTQRALDTLLLLCQFEEYRRLDARMPGCQWHLLGAEGMMPPPTRELLQDLIGRDTATARAATD